MKSKKVLSTQKKITEKKTQRKQTILRKKSEKNTQIETLSAPVPVQKDMPLHVYFVRHGETEKNRARIHQSPNTPIGAKGKDQILTTSEALRSVNATLLLSSEYTRALESARIIGMATGLMPVTNGLFYEIVRPSKFFERSILSLETMWYVCMTLLHRKDPRWHYYDAENMYDVSVRANRALAYLESLHGAHQSVIVVSHTVFINCLVSLMCTRKLFNLAELILTFLEIKRMKNGEIIHLEYVGKTSNTTCSWRRVHDV